jgi:hypothetical protein
MKKLLRKFVLSSIAGAFLVGAIPALADANCADPWSLLDPKCFKLR